MRLVWIGLLCLLAPTVGCAPKKRAPPPKPPTVIVARPLQRPIVDWDDYVGRFEAVDSVEVRPRVSGYLQSVEFSDGQVVRKGQLLEPLDHTLPTKVASDVPSYFLKPGFLSTSGPRGWVVCNPMGTFCQQNSFLFV